jgi:pimeloyl-ACP methyl ester carboxylesterase
MCVTAGRTLGLASLVGLLLLSGSGCNVVARRRTRLTTQLEDAGFSQRVLQLGADQVHTWVGGSGRPVVLIHGFGASTMWQWNPQALVLAREHRVIMPNLLWFGDSHSTSADYSIDHQVAAVIAALDELGIGEADIVGMSYGGFVAYELACAHPERVRRLVIVDSPGRVYTDADYEALLDRYDTDDFARILVPEDAAGVRTLIELAYDDPPWTPDWALRQTLAVLYANNRVEQAALLHQLLAGREVIVARPTRVQSPVLLIWGEHDSVFPLSLGERLAQSLGARLEVIAAARHFPNGEHVEAFNEILLGFLDGPTPTDGPPPNQPAPTSDHL